MATRAHDDAGRLVLANATPFLWRRSANRAKGMEKWTFPERVEPGATVEVMVEFKGGNGHAQASYQMEVEEGVSGEGNPTFTVTANHEGLSAALPKEMHKPGWFAVPPAPHKIAETGWQKGCGVSFTIGALGGDHPSLRGGHTARNFSGLKMATLKGVPSVGADRTRRGEVIPKNRASSSNSSGGGDRGIGGFFGGLGRQLGELLNDVGVGALPRPAGGNGEGNWTVEWMKRYGPAIENLSLAEMSLPGTHDSGTRKMHNPIVGPWATTQSLSIQDQLKAGVRVLDIRVGLVSREAEKSDNVHDRIAVVHDTHRTTTSLRQALNAVKSFVHHHHKEIVLLDFHRFPGLGHGAPHEKAAEVVVEVLGEVMIHPRFRNEPFGKLYNQPGRVAVLWNAVEARNPSFWPGVKQAWNGADKLRALYDMARAELSAKKDRLWSLPLVLPAGVPHPVPHIAEHVDEWMAVGGVWQDHASIVSADFVEETQLVRNCVGACLMKAARASASATSAHGGGKHGGHHKGGGGHKK